MKKEVNVRISLNHWRALSALDPKEIQVLVKAIDTGISGYRGKKAGFSIKSAPAIIEKAGKNSGALKALYQIIIDEVITGIEEDKAAQEARWEDSRE